MTRWLVVAVVALGACSDGGPTLPAALEFSVEGVDLLGTEPAAVVIRNPGGEALGPIELTATSLRDQAGSTAPGVHLSWSPAEVATLNPGSAREIQISVTNEGSLLPGRYDAVLTARTPEAQAVLAVRLVVDDADAAAAVSLKILASAADLRAGDVLPVPVEVRDATGALVQGVPVSWTLEPADGGVVGASGQFVAYRAGPVTLTATAGSASDALALDVRERGLVGGFEVVGRARTARRYTSDLWVHGDAAYSGTWGGRVGAEGTFYGNTLNVWDVSQPSAPSRTAEIELDARTVNDVKVRADGTLAVVTHEGSNDALNGITLLDLVDPLRPRIVGRFTEELQAGVHNAWVEGDHVYLVVDGVGNGLRILDVSDPANPSIVARYWAGESFLHDVYVRDGLAFLSHWNAGLVILDVGHGIAGGSPANPVEVSRMADLGGQTHNAWYWPQSGYLFVGEEDFSTPGLMHVIDVRSLHEPREVATYAVAGQPPHNFWLDEASATLYLAWYGQGLRALDVGGDLLGELDRQGREITGALYNGGTGQCDRTTVFTCTWAPQLLGGLLWVSDMNEGLVALRPVR